jgi:PHD/YefM family antitoxin component YafN of YafNO toxin-antitoxin module
MGIFIDIRYYSRYASKYNIWNRKELRMNTIPAHEIKRRGIAAVDDVIAKGDVHVIRNNQPRYVVLSEERYQELIVAEREAYYARVRASLMDVKGGKVRTFKSAEELMTALDANEDESCS